MHTTIGDSSSTTTTTNSNHSDNHYNGNEHNHHSETIATDMDESVSPDEDMPSSEEALEPGFRQSSSNTTSTATSTTAATSTTQIEVTSISVSSPSQTPTRIPSNGRVRAYSSSVVPINGNLQMEANGRRQTCSTNSEFCGPSVRTLIQAELSLTRSLASIHSVHPQIDLSLNQRFMLLPMNDQIRELQTVIRDKKTVRGNFKFYADRLIRLVVEEGLNQLPIESVEVRTPTGNMFSGIRYLKGNCGVSIVRSGESMEQGLRDCCRSIRIGKILIDNDENNQARVLYAKFPPDIAQRRILLLYPIMSTGLAVIESLKVLLSHGCKEENLILLNLFSSPKAAKLINDRFPSMFILTSDINPVCPNHFGHRYFGTD